jgi:molybdopterin synthase sulfur carrier subunit
MTIRVKFFASLREHLGQSGTEVKASQAKTVFDVWHIATDGEQMNPNTLSAVNMEYVDANHAVRDGDEVAFFPPVTGG